MDGGSDSSNGIFIGMAAVMAVLSNGLDSSSSEMKIALTWRIVMVGRWIEGTISYVIGSKAPMEPT